ncbi:hypothetical protein DY000_02024716 [Brassica cretica]|uniref:Replication factor A C-terminal domain-containing protein n=1 Tax=Brassica cretica TaxID=69181 RepID=A0ABQ7EF50_BRACR|nr:hypothetical protein DY000_02024716 [Brassica cretica]
MNSNSQTPVTGDVPATKPYGKDIVSSAEPIKRVDQTRVSLDTAAFGDSKYKKQDGNAVVSSAFSAKYAGKPEDSLAAAISGDSKSKKSNGKAVVSSADPVKRPRQHGVSLANAVSGDPASRKLNGKAVVSASDEVLFFKDLKFGPQEGELRFRHCDPRVHPTRIETYLPHMFAGSIYRLNNFYGSKSKNVYRVAEPDVIISFTWNYVLSVLLNIPVPFPEDRFRFYGYEEFEAACDLKGDLYDDVLFNITADYVGHLKLVNEQASRSLLQEEFCGPVMKLYLWDKAAAAFCEKFKALGKPPTVILVTTVNPKRFGGALTLSSFSSLRVFFDMDVQATREYLAWVNAEIVTKAETATIGELLSYMKHEGEKVAWFECTATIDDVVRDSAWYYIACGGCKTKTTKGPTTLMCKKCGKTDIVGATEYLTKIAVYDNNDHASFVLLGDAGRELAGMKASELVESYFEANESVGDDHVVLVPHSLTDSIGQTRTFIIKVSKHNLDGKTQSLTVTKVLPLEVPTIEGNIDEDVEEEPADDNDGGADVTVKRNFDGIESGETKRAKCV